MNMYLQNQRVYGILGQINKALICFGKRTKH